MRNGLFKGVFHCLDKKYKNKLKSILDLQRIGFATWNSIIVSCLFTYYPNSTCCHTTHICNGFFLTTSFEKWGKTDHFIKIMNPRYLTFLYLDFYNFNYMAAYLVESVCCKKQQKSSWPVTCLWNIWWFWMVKDWSWMISGITWTYIQSIWNHSGPSEVPHSANQ